MTSTTDGRQGLFYDSVTAIPLPDGVVPYCPHFVCKNCKHPDMEAELVKSLKMLSEIERLVRDWRDKQGHQACWYYPEIFREICKVLGVECHLVPSMSRECFRAGCERYMDEVYK